MAQDQGITREGRGEEQPKDKERAQTAPTKLMAAKPRLSPCRNRPKTVHNNTRCDRNSGSRPRAKPTPSARDTQRGTA